MLYRTQPLKAIPRKYLKYFWNTLRLKLGENVEEVDSKAVGQTPNVLVYFCGTGLVQSSI